MDKFFRYITHGPRVPIITVMILNVRQITYLPVFCAQGAATPVICKGSV